MRLGTMGAVDSLSPTCRTAKSACLERMSLPADVAVAMATGTRPWGLGVAGVSEIRRDRGDRLAAWCMGPLRTN